MDGKQLLQAVLDRTDDTSLVNRETHRRQIFAALDQAAQFFCRRTRIYKREVTITTVAGQQDYPLPPDFLDLYLSRQDGTRYVRYTAGSDVFWPRVVAWNQIFRLNLTDRQEGPARVTVREIVTTPANITGTTSAAGAAVRGAAILTDAAKNFLTTARVYPRDTIHNETKASDGIVVAVTDATHLVCALFEGKSQGFASGDAYTIVPAAKQQLTLEAPALTAGHTIFVPYVGMPDPVFTDYGSWRITDTRCFGIAAGAAMLLQLPESSWEEAKVMSGQFVEEIRQTSKEVAHTILRETKRPAWSGW